MKETEAELEVIARQGKKWLCKKNLTQPSEWVLQRNKLNSNSITSRVFYNYCFTKFVYRKLLINMLWPNDETLYLFEHQNTRVFFSLFRRCFIYNLQQKCRFIFIVLLLFLETFFSRLFLGWVLSSFFK